MSAEHSHFRAAATKLRFGVVPEPSRFMIPANRDEAARQ